MKKILAFLLILLGLTLFCACEKEPETLTIIAEDDLNVPAGEYTLRYSITDYEKYHDSYHLQISVNVYDENNKSIEVSNNRTITVQAEKTYTVVVRLTGNVKGKDIYRSKQYTIETVRNDVTVKLILKDGNYVKTYSSRILEYGGSLPISDIPDVPHFYAEQNDLEGHTREIISKKWVVYEGDEYHDLSQADLTNVRADLNIYSFYEYDDKILTYTVEFQSNGGTSIESVSGTINDTFYRPNISPTKEGYVFLGWCTDEEATQYYNWKKQYTFKSNMTLYARWAVDNKNATESAPKATADSYFTYTQDIDDYGNPYYLLSVRENQLARLPENLVLPSCHEGLPVRDLPNGAFGGASITSVYIPQTYTLNSDRAFASCKKLTTVEFEADSLRLDLNPYVFFECVALTSVKLPSRLELINDGCFGDCINLSDIILPESLICINERAFANCKSLTSVNIPDAVAYIYDGAYTGCSTLENVSLSASSKIDYISPSAFDETAIKKMTLPWDMQGQIAFDNQEISIEYHPPVAKTE